MRVGLDDAMGLGGRAGDVAWQLRPVTRRRQRGEELGLGIAELDLERGPVDRRAIEPGRRAGLQPPESEAGRRRGFGRAKPRADRRSVRPASAGRPDGSFRAERCRWSGQRLAQAMRPAVGELNASDSADVGVDPGCLPFDDASGLPSRRQAAASRAGRACGRPGRGAPARPAPCGD